MLKLLKWPKISILLVYFVPNYYHFEFHMIMNNFKCPHYAKHQAPVSSENQNILKVKVVRYLDTISLVVKTVTTNAK